ncbi:MAG: family 16 glycosylhydrolase [Cyclobacteriaceae bacterium]|nr:family 16 glycosylhydrolase [Cyclobacteriaceae bacterium]
MKYFLAIVIVAGQTVFCGCSGDSTIVKPEISASSLRVAEGNSTEIIAEVKLSINEPAREDIVISFSTEDRTAKSGKDYTGTDAGSVTLSAGSSSVNLAIPILPDDNLEFTEEFVVRLKEPENASLSSEYITIRIQDNDQFVPESDAEGTFSPASYPDLILVWGEEFNGPGIDTEAWTFELGDGCPDLCGWGNNELQDYTAEEENVRISNGKLVITALKEDNSQNYTSARMITRGNREFQYGRIDIRARLPYGQGIWPAIWMLGANIGQVGWPRCGEIDIMELVGHLPGVSHGTAHFDVGGWQSKGSSYSLSAGQTFTDEFHVFSILWEKDNIKWYVDYQKFFELSGETVGGTYPFNNPFFFILNIAVGGNWPGNPDGTTVFPQVMEIDYIRVFQPQG